jgi:hypothetical protein
MATVNPKNQIEKVLRFRAIPPAKGLRATIAVFSLVSTAVLFVTALPYLSERILPPFVFPIQFCALAAAGLGCVASAALAVLVSRWRERLLYVCVTLIFPLAVTTALWAARHHVYLRRDWFLREGIKPYERMVAIMATNKSMLSAKPQFLSRFGEMAVSARTNADGSLTIWFKPRDGDFRLGYLYDPRPNLAADPLDTKNAHFCRLTNGWYEF